MNFTITKTASFGGVTFNENRTVTATGGITKEQSLPAAKTGSLTTRTSDSVGELTMTAGHGITTGQRLDIYWDIGGVTGHRRGVTVGTVAVNAVPITGGTGDVLPVDESAVTAMVPVELDARFDGDEVVAIAVTGAGPSIVVFADDADAELHFVHHPLSSQVTQYFSTSGVTNPLAGEVVDTVFISHGDSAGSKTVKIAVGVNS